MSNRRQRVSQAQQELQEYHGQTRRVVVDIAGLSHAEVGTILLGGPWGQLKGLLRFSLSCVLYLCPFQGFKIMLYRAMGMHIGRNVYISPTVFIDATRPDLLHIGDDVMLGMGASIAVHERNMQLLALGRVRIENGATIGGKSLVRHGVTIGAGITVDAMSNVKKDMLS